jgi:hypothetical protein
VAKFRPLKSFWLAYAQLPEDIKDKAREAFQLFQSGVDNPPFHPSLRIRKMEGHTNIWEGHITLQYVFTFHVEEDLETGERIFVFRKIGTHGIYRNP